MWITIISSNILHIKYNYILKRKEGVTIFVDSLFYSIVDLSEFKSLLLASLNKPDNNASRESRVFINSGKFLMSQLGSTGPIMEHYKLLSSNARYLNEIYIEKIAKILTNLKINPQ